jgi:hypothetical protein
VDQQYQLDLFRERLPYRPYATDNFRIEGLHRYSREIALQKRFIQPNPHVLQWWLVFDVDRPGAAYDWQIRDLPAPNLSVENPKNRHAHLYYRLDVAVYKGDPVTHKKAIYLCALVENGLREALEADKSYGGLISKTPYHADWTTTLWREWGYDLAELSDYLSLERIDMRRRVPSYGVGRNVNLFNTVRVWAYKAVRQYWEGAQDAFFEAVLIHTATENTKLTPPLDQEEFKHIAKSIAKWVWYNFSPRQFSAIQRARGLKGNKASLNVRRKKAEKTRDMIYEIRATYPTASNREIARQLGIALDTVNRAMKQTRQKEPDENADLGPTLFD